MLYPRIAYLPLLLPKLHAFFRELLINEETNHHDGWFSYENVPLKWQFPVGLLFDIYSGNSDRLHDENGNGSKKESSPVDPTNSGNEIPRTWQLTLHFDDWPSEVLVKLDDQGKHLRDAFTNSYKEVSNTCHDTAPLVDNDTRRASCAFLLLK